MMFHKFLHHMCVLLVLSSLSQALAIRNNDVKNGFVHPSLQGIESSDSVIATKLLKTYEDFLKTQKEFQNAFETQQDLMAEMSTGKKISTKNRFMQVQEQGADPRQIWRGLYDTQPLRGPPQATIHVFDGEDTTKISEEATELAMQAEQAEMLANFHEAAKEFQQQGLYDRMNNQILNESNSFTQSLKKQVEPNEEISTKVQVVASMGTRSGPKIPPPPVIPNKHPLVKEPLVTLSAGKLPCAKTLIVPVFRQKSVQPNNNVVLNTDSNKGRNEVNNLQVVSPFVSTVSELDTKSIPEDEVPAGYYGETRITL